MENMKDVDDYGEPHVYPIDEGDFVFNPACGEYNVQEQNVAVSGFVIPYGQIDHHGSSYKRLSDVFRKIEKRTKQRKKAEPEDTRSEFERAVDEVNKNRR